MWYLYKMEINDNIQDRLYYLSIRAIGSNTKSHEPLEQPVDPQFFFFFYPPSHFFLGPTSVGFSVFTLPRAQLFFLLPLGTFLGGPPHLNPSCLVRVLFFFLPSPTQNWSFKDIGWNYCQNILLNYNQIKIS